MKLIDLLVQELPKRGGWPEKACLVAQDPSGYVCFSCSQQPLYFNDTWVGGDWLPSANFYADAGRADDNKSAIITLAQYEAALAAAQQPAWSGEGLPPVGTECEFNAYDGGWGKCVVLYSSEYTVLLRTNRTGDPEEAFVPEEDVKFRPIRSEVDKKRDAIVEALAYHTNAADAVDLYKAIEAGEVKGVKLDV